MIVVMNVVSAAEGKADAFEEAFRARESHLATVPGFVDGGGGQLSRGNEVRMYDVLQSEAPA